ncbi:MAG TPA: tetratricopeptide repeat protein [Saprospiraceae bacterium]|nr:tetratricopeptide repeat protein [Saprospiraceae bacterium]
MKRLTFLWVLFAGLAMGLQAQPLDEEIGFKLVKAEYLINTERFEDAIKELNAVILENPNYKNALLLRAETKYKLAAYKGAKNDAMEYITSHGITAKAASILGKSEFAMGNDDPALNSLTAATSLGESDFRIYEIKAEILERKNQKISACEAWQAAARLGSTKAAINARKLCGTKTEVPVQQVPVNNDATHTDDNDATHHEEVNPGTVSADTSVVAEGEVISEGSHEATDSTKTENAENQTSGGQTNDGGDLLIPDEDNTINSIVIDEELTLELFGQGLGKRRVLERPSILILAEKDGLVTVEICVNAEGRVDYAEFVASKSTLSQNSLVSLAIRKAKEFWFEDSDYPKQCGFIRFKIKGS